MSFKFACPHCGQRIGATLEDVGAFGGCPSCQSQVVVPAPPEPVVAEADEVAPEPAVPPVTHRGVASGALVLSIFPVVNLVGLGLAIYAVVRSDRPGRSGERGLAIASVVVAGLFLVPVNVAGILVASTTTFFRSAGIAPGLASRVASPSPTPAKAVRH